MSMGTSDVLAPSHGLTDVGYPGTKSEEGLPKTTKVAL